LEIKFIIFESGWKMKLFCIIGDKAPLSFRVSVAKRGNPVFIVVFGVAKRLYYNWIATADASQ